MTPAAAIVAASGVYRALDRGAVRQKAEQDKDLLISPARTPLGALAHQLYSAHQAAGNGGRDFSSIIQALRDRSPA